jgi:benzoyl-CoA reductase/2-hydroxyglutaryl-CoA dehydratase subunit BcrC/BadD/HgdB
VHAQIVLFNKARRLLKKISELRKRKNPPLSGKDFLELVRGYYYLPPQKLIDTYEALYKKLSAVRDDGARPVRLMISGSIMADGDRRLVELIEDEIGARVAVEDHCTGLKPFTHTVDETGDPFRALANGYLDQAPCARMKPLDDSVSFSTALAQEYDVEGVVFAYLKFCACYGVTKSEFIASLQKVGIPVLEISSDYSVSDHGQLKTRVEAFIEVLTERRATATVAAD